LYEGLLTTGLTKIPPGESGNLHSIAPIKKKQVRFRQIFVTISKVSPNIRDKSCQKCVTIRVTLRSILLSFCQICVTITSRDMDHTFESLPGHTTECLLARQCKAAAGLKPLP
jgi:hypothetical protein